jgi:hypothetical protein
VDVRAHTNNAPKRATAEYFAGRAICNTLAHNMCLDSPTNDLPEFPTPPIATENARSEHMDGLLIGASRCYSSKQGSFAAINYLL